MGSSVRVNFHCHSALSDGSMPPERIAEALAAAGVRFAALTDHDTTEGLEGFEQALASCGVVSIPGVEITVDGVAEPAEESFHLLAFGFDPENPELQRLLLAHRRARAVRQAALTEDLRRAGARLRSMFREDSAEALHQAAAGAVDVIRTVHRAGGTVFLAHPLAICPDLERLDRWLTELKALGLDGVEAVYSAYPPETREALAQLARRHDLLICGGTDFHGFDQPGLNQVAIDMPTDDWAAFRQAHRIRATPAPSAPAREGPPAARETVIGRRVTKSRASRLRWGRFVLRIVFPTALAMALFLLAIFGVIIPSFEANLLDRKREMIRELTNSAWSILAEYEREEREGAASREEAQARAVSRIEFLRYGQERKDYFWIIDMHPRMIMHPYRKELNGTDLSTFEDVRGDRLFVEFARVAREKGEGYVEYYWQWKDNPDRVAPKQSFVKRFEPWGWAIGTGIYLDDVSREIDSLTGRLLRWCLGITGVIAGLLAYMTRESLLIEKRRGRAENELRESHEKYAALVEASTEGTLMVLEGKCAYANKTMSDMLGYTEEELSRLRIEDLFPPVEEAVGEDGRPPLGVIGEILDGKPGSSQFEAPLVKKGGERIEALLAVTRIAFAGKRGFILVARDITPHRLLEAELGHSREQYKTLAEKLDITALLFLNEPLRRFQRDLPACDMRAPLREAIQAMSGRNDSGGGALAVTAGPGGEVVGIVTDLDLRTRVLADTPDLARPVFEVMSAPVVSLPDSAPVYEAVLTMQEKGIRHLGVRGPSGRVAGIVHNADLMHIHEYAPAVVTREIQNAGSARDIARVRAGFPRLVRTLVECGARPRAVNRVTTRLSDAIVERLIGMAVARLGPPPARFCFLALGSEGRAEQTLVTDQDNALLYENPPAADADGAEAYLLELGTLVCGWLDDAGYAVCRGDVMARNPRWCRPLEDWKLHFLGWITASNPQDLLEFNMFFDFRCVHGDHDLVRDLRGAVHQAMLDNPPFFLHMAQNALLYKPPLGFFGQIVTDSGGQSPHTFNIKEAMLPIVNFARLYSLKHQMEETNTLDRLGRLLELQALKPSFHDDLVQAYTFLMQLRLTHQARELADGAPPDNLINPKSLSHMDEAMLKEALSVIATLRKKISFDFLGMA